MTCAICLKDIRQGEYIYGVCSACAKAVITAAIKLDQHGTK